MKIKARRKARLHAIQALYQHQIAITDFNTLKTQYYLDNESKHPVEWPFFYDLLDGIHSYKSIIDDALAPFLDRAFNELTPIELAVLRLGAYELFYRWEIPYQVVIKEYVDQAEVLGTQDGYKFINGVLERIAQHTKKSNTIN